MTKWTEPSNALDVSGMQQSVDHVEDKQRLHSVVGKAFPGFGEREIAEAARMPDEAVIVGITHGPQSVASRQLWQARRVSEFLPWRESTDRKDNDAITGIAVQASVDLHRTDRWDVACEQSNRDQHQRD